MQEDFLHYLWKHKRFNVLDLKTTDNEEVIIVDVGEHNLNAGPDFFSAKINIDQQLWAGNVEIHVKSSDWYIHNHETDKAYDNVILHVVWEHDNDVFRKDNSKIPTLELKDYIDKSFLENYLKLFSKNEKWINCQNDFYEVNQFVIDNWLERLYFERLERKSLEIEVLLKKSNNDWEEVLFKMLAKNFGLKVNGDAFLSLANSIEFSIIRKLQSKLLSVEAIFYGQAGLLEGDVEEQYYKELQQEYAFLKQKFQISANGVMPLHFFRLRPVNFPTIRLSQLSVLYYKHKNLFSTIINAKRIDEIYTVFKAEASTFWSTHYTFDKPSRASKKHLSKSFIDLLIINTIIPLKFSYAKFLGKPIDEEIIELINSLSSEKNSIINKFNEMKLISKSALHSQALLQLKQNYCNKNKCLQCAIGNKLLSRKM